MNNAECSACGALIDTTLDTPVAQAWCPACGSSLRNFNCSIHESITVRDEVGVKVKRAGESRPFIEDRAVPVFSRDRQKLVREVRIIDRDNDQYSKTITDYETGEVIYQCDEPLSEHQGRGDARPKYRPPIV